MSTASKPKQTKVRFLVPSLGIAAGDEVDVDSDTVDHLVENGHAQRIETAKSADKS